MSKNRPSDTTQGRRCVCIVGAGAAGMMAAVAAAENGAEVTVFERNARPGKKLFITGKGRCNLTYNRGREDFFAHVRRNPKFLYSAYASFDEDAVRDFFESAGCPLKAERGGRVFPVSDKSSDVIHALTARMQALGIHIIYEARVMSLLTKPVGDASLLRRVAGVRVETKEGTKEVASDAVILATGGLSYPSTGSTGDGYALAKEAGHEILPQSPSEVPFIVSEADCKELQGLSLKNVALTMDCPGKKGGGKAKPVFEGFGEMLFTHYGVSGPLVLSASSFYEPEQKTLLHIDLKPALSPEALDARLLRDFEAARNRQFQNALGNLFPKKLIPVMVRRSGIDPEKRAAEVTAKKRRAFAALIKDLTFTVTGTRGFKEAVVTKGGVSTKEIDPKTMESKLCQGLFFAGEVMDVDAVTGGYNLQIAWSTGHAAGTKAAENRRETSGSRTSN